MNLNSVKEAVPQAASKPLSNPLAKRCFDVIASLTAIIVLSPALVAVAAFIWVMDGGPVIFKQQRIGMGNQRFVIWKFRTMKVNSQQSKHHHYNWTNGIPDDRNIQTTSSIPDVTKIGAFLRKYSLDELPQFFNVLTGDMSVVGPRPEIPEIASHYNERQIRRLEVKPGITGYAQINGRSNISHGEKIMHDLYYVDNRSFHLDLLIVLKTIVLVISRKGAY